MGDCACHASDLRLRWDEDHLAFVFLELTSACNNRCTGCSNIFTDQHARAPLSGRQWIELIQRIQPHVKWVKLTGGEPTLHPDFEAIIAHLERLNLPFRLLTNGRWPNFQRTLDVLTANSMLESILISLHGPDAESHEAFSNVSGSFQEAAFTIAQAAERGIKVATSTVLTQYNWDRVKEMIRAAQSLGADHLAFNRYIGPPLPELESDHDQNLYALRQIEQLLRDGYPVRYGTPVPKCLTATSTEPCLAGRAFVTVNPWGKVRPCNHTPLHIGNLWTTSLPEILASPALKTWLDYPPECRDCHQIAACEGGCRAELMLRERVVFNYEIPSQEKVLIPA